MTVLSSILVLALVGAEPVPSAPADAGSAEVPAPITRLVWERSLGHDAVVRVTGTSEGREHPKAHQMVQRIADRLDALRTVQRHVVWTRIVWEEGRVEVDARAETGVYGNLVLLAVRDLLPGRSTAGSGVGEIRGGPGAFPWRVRMLLSPPARRSD